MCTDTTSSAATESVYDLFVNDSTPCDVCEKLIAYLRAVSSKASRPCGTIIRATTKPGSSALSAAFAQRLPVYASQNREDAFEGALKALKAIAEDSGFGALLIPEGGEALKWVEWCLNESEGAFKLSKEGVEKLDKALEDRVFLLGGSNITLADFVVAHAAERWVSKASQKELAQHCNITRWYHHISTLPGSPYPESVVDLHAVSRAYTNLHKGDAVVGGGKGGKGSPKKGGEATGEEAAKKKAERKAKNKEKQAKAQKETRPVEDVSRLNMIVGKINKVWEHPDAEKLWCEEIDCGEPSGPRQIASGLRDFYKEASDLEGRKVVILANLKPRPLRGFVSHGMVMCASTNDHSQVEVLDVPKDAKPGDRISIPGFDGEPDEVLHPKHNPFDAVKGDLKTVKKEDGLIVATYKGKAFTLPSGEVVTAPGLADCEIS
ncbi:methionyl-tRNA synthetase, putative [Perkinsus marinus ATCC 50983]|uniref:Methionyl-tRNA synthetase, putative n=1 Tax=Perkinsus marinus (strain ATCC 50983 / TXsc) TaxID=423536 RepID=C5K7F4_PERM5|nr:methionyl-tRNA synthetase, putative [Perkinsus marinus ATCC 50983]EER19489.1 methionyl-tRNA synthetase, putative [Perkinsus marinus ATCC 50983]|eukprot:XP_002787693.1 methionyl-tRNA synthetase, putative [Perkinsus marinus ATCC 50983]